MRSRSASVRRAERAKGSGFVLARAVDKAEAGDEGLGLGTLSSERSSPLVYAPGLGSGVSSDSDVSCAIVRGLRLRPLRSL